MLAGAIVLYGKLATEASLKAEAIDAIDVVLDEDQYRTTARAAYVSASCLSAGVRPGGT